MDTLIFIIRIIQFSLCGYGFILAYQASMLIRQGYDELEKRHKDRKFNKI